MREKIRVADASKVRRIDGFQAGFKQKWGPRGYSEALTLRSAVTRLS